MDSYLLSIRKVCDNNKRYSLYRYSHSVFDLWLVRILLVLINSLCVLSFLVLEYTFSYCYGSCM